MTKQTGWPSGPWDAEPDDLFFVHRGLSCELRRCKRMGAWHGTVVVPAWHACYDRPPILDVHGGVNGVHTSPYETRYDFDCCSHYLDFAPGDPSTHQDGYTYRTIDYAQMQARHLADQLARCTVRAAMFEQIAGAIRWGAKRALLRVSAGVLRRMSMPFTA